MISQDKNLLVKSLMLKVLAQSHLLMLQKQKWVWTSALLSN